MAEDWRTAYGRVKMELNEYKETIVPALMEKVQALEQRWIPVTERLPDWRDGKVLVFTKYGFSICERTVNGRWKGQHANWITHWMEMPEPPRENVDRRIETECANK